MFKDFDLDLLNMKGYEALHQAIKVWEIVKKNIVTSTEDAQIFLPNYFWVADQGTPIQALIRIFSDRLHELGIMPFSNSRLHIEFILEYDKLDHQFESFERLYNLLEHGLSQFGEPFAGVLMIDITEWIEQDACNDRRFLRFLDYLTQRDDIQMIVLYSECNKVMFVKHAEAIISSRLRIRTIRINHPEAETFLQKMLEIVDKLGLTIDGGAQSVLLETISKAIKKRGFNGLFTIKSLAKELTYEKYRQPSFERSVITLEDIADFTPTGRWLKQLDVTYKEGL
jgi:hypothetical protein